MGLTLNTNSLTLASSSGASGVSTSDVTTLIKNNTSWQFIAKLTASTSTALEYTSLTTAFQTFRIIYEDLTYTQNSHTTLQLYLDGTLETSNNYRTGGRASMGSSVSNINNTYGYWGVTDGYESGSGDRHLMGYTDFGCNNTSSSKHMLSDTTSSSSTQASVYRLGGYLSTGNNKLITGFKLNCTSGNWSKGSIKIYGMN